MENKYAGIRDVTHCRVTRVSLFAVKIDFWFDNFFYQLNFFLRSKKRFILSKKLLFHFATPLTTTPPNII